MGSSEWIQSIRVDSTASLLVSVDAQTMRTVGLVNCC